MPRSDAAARSMLSTPTPLRLITLRPGAAAPSTIAADRLDTGEHADAAWQRCQQLRFARLLARCWKHQLETGSRQAAEFADGRPPTKNAG